VLRTAEKQALSGVEELVFTFGAGDGVESPYTHDFLDGVTGAVIGVRISAQNTAEICLKPQFVGRDALVATFVYAVALYRARNVDLYAHVQSRESIVATEPSALLDTPRLRLIPVESRDDLVLLVVRRVCERVDVGSQTGRR
jgi:hypothetical protein